MSTFTKQAAQAARNLRAEIKRMTAKASLIKRPEVKAAFEAFPLSMRKHVSLSIAAYSSTVYISTTVRGLDSFKDAKLTRLLEKFLDWETHVNDYTGSDTPNKDFAFTKKLEGMEIRVCIYAYVKSDSPLCRIVVTGVTERVVREEVKQIVCA
jgi:hypothetical protein